MTFNTDVILQALNDGTSAEDLAKQFADALNTANATIAAQKKKETAKKDAALAIVDAILNYIRNYEPTTFKTLGEPTDADRDYLAKELISVIGQMSSLMNAVPGILDNGKFTFTVKDEPKTDPLEEFLKEYKLK